MSKLENDLIQASALRDAGFCCKGAKALLESYGFSWRQFVLHGLTISELSKINDPQINELLKWVSEKNKK